MKGGQGRAGVGADGQGEVDLARPGRGNQLLGGAGRVLAPMELYEGSSSTL